LPLRCVDNRDPKSLASRLRKRRNEKFRDSIYTLPRPLNILDVGGTAAVWRTIGFANAPDIRITLFNLKQEEVHETNIISMVGDARSMKSFTDAQFDVAYSNSVIEHLGNMEDMKKMAREIRRVSRIYFLQTPYKYFPIEPHFMFPLFQFLPICWRIYLIRHFNLAWAGKISDYDSAERAVKSITLLSKAQLQSLFPDARITTEKVLGFPKSLLAQTVSAL
jgi:hypothetical protein